MAERGSCDGRHTIAGRSDTAGAEAARPWRRGSSSGRSAGCTPRLRPRGHGQVPGRGHEPQDRRRAYALVVGPEDADDLASREAALAERERQAAAGPSDPARGAELARERDALADARDDAADARDAAALTRRERAAARDLAASERDRRTRLVHDDVDPGFPDRFMSARDVDASAGDRADAMTDERRAREDRQRSREDRRRAAGHRDAAARAAHAAAEEAADLRERLQSRPVIGQAQGLLMAEHGITADEALDLLVEAARTSNVELRDVAARLVQRRADG